MRRGFSIFLILVIGFGPLSSLIDGSADTNLPSCCRRHGMHHCAMEMDMAAMGQQQQDKTVTISAPITCPFFPGAAAMLTSTTPALAAAFNSANELSGVEFLQRVEETARRSGAFETHFGRGPPASNLA